MEGANHFSRPEKGEHRRKNEGMSKERDSVTQAAEQRTDKFTEDAYQASEPAEKSEDFTKRPRALGLPGQNVPRAENQERTMEEHMEEFDRERDSKICELNSILLKLDKLKQDFGKEEEINPEEMVKFHPMIEETLSRSHEWLDDKGLMEPYVQELKNLESSLEADRVKAENARTRIANSTDVEKASSCSLEDLKCYVKDFDDRVEHFQSKLKDTLRRGIRQFQHHDATFSDFKFIRRLGAGSYGYVDEVSYARNALTFRKKPVTYARKAIQHTSGVAEDSFSSLVKEFWILKDLHQLSFWERVHFIRVQMVYTINLNTDYGQYFLVMSPVADGGNLTKFLNNNNPHRLSTSLFEMMGCLASGLAILHKACIRHHDIHPGNILIDNGKPIYADFGFAISFKHPSNSRTHNKNQRHHWQYAAPESERSTKSDVFALGGVLYNIAAVITGDQDMLRHCAMNSNTAFGDPVDSSAAMRSLLAALNQAQDTRTKFWLNTIMCMLQFDPEERMSARQIFALVAQFGRKTGGEGWLCTFCDRAATEMGLE